MTPLISPTEASDLISNSLPSSRRETVSLENAFGRVLHQPVLSDRPVPPFDRAMMDGIAISSNSERVHFRVAGTQAAGAPSMTLLEVDSCFEIMTGAPMPIGCDCVIPIEQVTLEAGFATVTSSYSKGDFIHPLGSDHPKGATLIDSGVVIGPAELAIAASSGATSLTVAKLPEIHLITTGDEVIPPADTPEIFQIRSSHPIAIRSTIQAQSLGNVTHTHISDNPRQCKEVLSKALSSADVLILTGGVSKGKFDFVAPTLNELVGAPLFHGVSQRPGKPLAYYSSPIPVFALPGNPLSVMACMARYVLPALKQILSIPNGVRDLPLAIPTQTLPQLTHLLASKVENGVLTPAKPNNSGDYAAVVGCHGVSELTPGQGTLEAEHRCTFYPWI